MCVYVSESVLHQFHYLVRVFPYCQAFLPHRLPICPYPMWGIVFVNSWAYRMLHWSQVESPSSCSSFPFIFDFSALRLIWMWSEVCVMKGLVCLALNYFLCNFNFVHYQLADSLSSFLSPRPVWVLIPRKWEKKSGLSMGFEKPNHMHERFRANKIPKIAKGPEKKGKSFIFSLCGCWDFCVFLLFLIFSKACSFLFCFALSIFG